MQLSFFKNLWYAWKNRHEPECALLIANILWRSILILLTGALVGFTAYGAWIFFTLTGSTETSAPTPQGETLDVAQLERVLQTFEGRVERYNEITSEPAPFANPRQ